MAFEYGSISFRMLQIPHPLPDDAVDLFAARAAPGVDSVRAEPSRGWVTGRHLLDRAITEETAYYGGYLRLTLQQAERKAPTGLLDAECAMEELALMAAEGKQYLVKKERAEIRRSVLERLLPKMPPQLKGTPFVYAPGDTIVYAQAAPVKQCDDFTMAFQSTVGSPIVPLTPDTAALERNQVDVYEWQPVSFSPKLGNDSMMVESGRDFLTWLWFMSESAGGTVSLGESAPVGVLIEGPLTFTHEGSGAHETLLRKGEPVGSAEAKTCLMAGKKLRQAKLTLVQNEDVWQCTLNADEFAFRSLTLPKSDQKLDPISLFQERMQRLAQFKDLFLTLHDMYMHDRCRTAEWSALREKIHEWGRSRVARV